MPKQRTKDSFVWLHFEDEGNEHAKCKVCKKVLSTSGGSTSGLVRHLKSIHDICSTITSKSSVTSTTMPSTSSSSSSVLPSAVTPKTIQSPQGMLMNFDKKETTQEKVARLVAEDGMPIAMIQHSKTLRSALSSQGHQLPKSGGAIMDMVHKQFHQVKDEHIQYLARIKSKGERLSVTLDEFTSTSNRRYMNVNVHQAGGKVLNLAMIRMPGSFPADKCL